MLQRFNSFNRLRSLLIPLLIGLLLIGAAGPAEAGLISGGFKMAKDTVKLFKRQFPTGAEKELLRSGARVRFQGKDVIRRNSTFDPHARDALGRTSLERMKNGNAPVGRDGVEVQLHHYQQRDKGPLIEMTATEHRQLSKDLHRYTRESEIDRQAFNRWKQGYWRERAREF